MAFGEFEETYGGRGKWVVTYEGDPPGIPYTDIVNGKWEVFENSLSVRAVHLDYGNPNYLPLGC
ncbi:hypothetical protein M1N56_05620 [Dehalococcoidia bacterium]|nr:hypothetical protein [Dehalococcoidia bacterium]